MKIIFVNFLKIYLEEGRGCAHTDNEETHERLEKQEDDWRRRGEGRRGEKKKRETGRSLRAWTDPPPCSARLVITRQGRREREASKSPYGPLFLSLSLSCLSPFSFGLAWSSDPAAIIEIDILLMARTIIHWPFIELFPDNYESITII